MLVPYLPNTIILVTNIKEIEKTQINRRKEQIIKVDNDNDDYNDDADSDVGANTAKTDAKMRKKRNG